jgi:hypothetical protein
MKIKFRWRYNGLFLYCIILNIIIFYQGFEISKNIKRIDKLIKETPTLNQELMQSRYFEAWKCDLSMRLMDVEAMASTNYKLIRQVEFFENMTEEKDGD